MDSTSNLSLYLPEKYRVIAGKHTNLGLCTCWTDPNVLLARDPALTDTFAILGTLYSREGVSVLLRNLCLNPYITKIVVWGNSPLSNTAIGASGRNLLLNFFERGVNDENQVNGSPERIHKQISRDIIENVRKKVQVIDLSPLPYGDLLKETKSMKATQTSMYMDPVSFPEPSREALSAMPSEKVGIAVRSKTLTGAWIKVVDRIIRYGAVKTTENSSNQKELQCVSWTIESEDPENLHMPDWPDTVKSHIGLDLGVLNQYKTIFTDPAGKDGSAYTYGNRLNNYIGHINQIEEIVKKIKQKSVTRQAFATTFYPPEDLHNPSPPCLTSIQLLADSDNQLNMFATFRSHDIFKAAIPNAYGLLHLHDSIANKAHFKKGSLTIISTSAHIYEEDWQMALNTVKCAYWERTKLYFDENEDIDPRGIVRISLSNRMIHVEVLSDSGEELYIYDGATAREVAMKLARLELLSLFTHYVDITIELTKAEIALKKGIDYVQDKPLVLSTHPNVVIK